MPVSTGVEELLVSGGKEAMTDLEEPLSFDFEGRVSTEVKRLPEGCVLPEGDGPSLMPMTTDL